MRCDVTRGCLCPLSRTLPSGVILLISCFILVMGKRASKYNKTNGIRGHLELRILGTVEPGTFRSDLDKGEIPVVRKLRGVNNNYAN